MTNTTIIFIGIAIGHAILGGGVAYSYYFINGILRRIYRCMSDLVADNTRLNHENMLLRSEIESLKSRMDTIQEATENSQTDYYDYEADFNAHIDWLRGWK